MGKPGQYVGQCRAPRDPGGARCDLHLGFQFTISAARGTVVLSELHLALCCANTFYRVWICQLVASQGVMAQGRAPPGAKGVRCSK